MHQFFTRTMNVQILWSWGENLQQYGSRKTQYSVLYKHLLQSYPCPLRPPPEEPDQVSEKYTDDGIEIFQSAKQYGTVQTMFFVVLLQFSVGTKKKNAARVELPWCY